MVALTCRGVAQNGIPLRSGLQWRLKGVPLQYALCWSTQAGFWRTCHICNMWAPPPCFAHCFVHAASHQQDKGTRYAPFANIKVLLPTNPNLSAAEKNVGNIPKQLTQLLALLVPPFPFGFLFSLLVPRSTACVQGLLSSLSSHVVPPLRWGRLPDQDTLYDSAPWSPAKCRLNPKAKNLGTDATL